MAFKAINDLVGPNRTVPILLIFRAYLRITKLDLLVLSVIKRAYAIYKAIKEVRRIYTKRQVINALVIRNGLNTLITTNLPINSNIRV